MIVFVALQLIKQTRGNANSAAKGRAWQLFFITAASMPPGKDFTSLVSGARASSCFCKCNDSMALTMLDPHSSIPFAEYVHSVANDDNEPEEIRAMASKTWHAMKRTTKAGQRRSVR